MAFSRPMGNYSSCCIFFKIELLICSPRSNGQKSEQPTLIYQVIQECILSQDFWHIRTNLILYSEKRLKTIDFWRYNRLLLVKILLDFAAACKFQLLKEHNSCNIRMTQSVKIFMARVSL